MNAAGTVTIRCQRICADSKSDMSGFFIPYGCAGRGGGDTCTLSPTLLMTSNIQQAAACINHTSTVLNSLIDEVLRSRNGERGYGFLHQTGTSRPHPQKAPAAEAIDEIVWQNQLDGRYDVLVFRSQSPYTGVLVVRDAATELSRSTVALAYDAVLGPDAADVQEWMDTAIAVVDEIKPPEQLVAEALEHIEVERQARIAQLRRSPNAGEAYKLAVELYRIRESAVNWLITPNAALNGKAPVDVLDEPNGIERMRRLLKEVSNTIYPLS